MPRRAVLRPGPLHSPAELPDAHVPRWWHTLSSHLTGNRRLLSSSGYQSSTPDPGPLTAVLRSTLPRYRLDRQFLRTSVPSAPRWRERKSTPANSHGPPSNGLKTCQLEPTLSSSSRGYT